MSRADEVGVCPGLTFERIFCDRAAKEIKAEFTLCIAPNDVEPHVTDKIETHIRNLDEVTMDIQGIEEADFDITRTPENDLRELNFALKLMQTHKNKCGSQLKFNQ